MNVFGLEHMNE